ncbi:hypothetical protein BCR44DRAFT_1433006 [Catenaria anguillulae PL171]|uniref:Uncharacterized protein n=1 Tax=Catenaria anguillulae PL171 TaxID=765915 RepID=A0A1Y2HRB0_9FUNG|nr:hypothetical protein BCR44DRAFT_1433006 [Catenaria anguillulae PL171]
MRLLTVLALAAILSVSLPGTLVQPADAEPLPAYMHSASAGLESIPLADFSVDEGPAAADFSQDSRRDDEDDSRERDEESDRSKDDEDGEDDGEDRRNEEEGDEDQEEDQEELDREINREEDDIDRESSRRFGGNRRSGRSLSERVRRAGGAGPIQKRLKGLVQLRKRLANRIRSERTQLARRGSRKPNHKIRHAQRQLKTINGLINGVRKGRPAALRAVNNLEREDSRIADLVNAPSKLPLKNFVVAAQKRTTEIRNRALIAVRTIDRDLRRRSIAVRRLQRTRQVQIRKAKALVKRVQAEIKDRYRIEREKLGRQAHKLREKLRGAQSALNASSTRSQKMLNQARVHALKARVAGLRAKAVQRRSEVRAAVARIRGGMAKVTSIKPPRMPGQIAGIRRSRGGARGRGRRRAVGRRGRRARVARRGRRGAVGRRGRRGAAGRRGRGRKQGGRRVSRRSAGKRRASGRRQQRGRVARRPQRGGARRGRAGNRPTRGGRRPARPTAQRKGVSRQQQQQRLLAQRRALSQRQQAQASRRKRQAQAQQQRRNMANRSARPAQPKVRATVKVHAMK